MLPCIEFNASLRNEARLIPMNFGIDQGAPVSGESFRAVCKFSSMNP
ncbi:hypothetical protein [Maridesulfovibrio frigidus]|nr:hypothetical protein [Maridesulfovibrio frigidus]